MHRPTIGLIALVLLALGAATIHQSDPTWSAACLRIGLVMGIWWFAFPQLATLPRWALIGSLVALVIAARWPRLLVMLVPVAAVLWLLAPRGRR